ncbi:MAG: efflux RND transporter periplasmic adaptor subunit [Pirellulales bacterium]
MPNPRRAERLRDLIRKRVAKRRWEAAVTVAIVSVAVVLPMLIAPPLVRWVQARSHGAQAPLEEPALVIFPQHPNQPLTIDRGNWSKLGLTFVEAKPSPPPTPLKMDGVLYLDPDDYVLVRSRFQGEIVSMPCPANSEKQTDANILHPTGTMQSNGLRFGDRVKKGDLLCVIWSRELGEKKSEMAQIQAQLDFDRDTLERLKPAQTAIPQKEIREVERRIKESEISIQKIENTLRSWQLNDAEIKQMRQEVDSNEKSSPSNDGNPTSRVDRWARVEVRAPIDGTIVEKDVTEGMLVDIDDTLYKIANLNHLDVRAFAYEEDLVTIQRLDPSQWNWTIHLKGDRATPAIQGKIDRIGSLIDPLQHTGLVMGWVDNTPGTLRPGQFVSAMVQLPETSPTLCVPAEAAVDLDGENYVLVQGAQADQFFPVKVIVDRFQDGLACLKLQPANATSYLKEGSTVVVNGAVELLAEYRLHLKTKPPEGKSQTSLTTSNKAFQELVAVLPSPINSESHR